MMNRIKFGYKSFGTIYGTVNDYDTQGVLTGPRNIAGWSIWFTVRNSWDLPIDQSLIAKTVGTGITINSGTVGLFTVTFQSKDLRWQPAEYVYDCFGDPSGGGTYIDGTTNVKSIGSGVFEILKGVTIAS